MVENKANVAEILIHNIREFVKKRPFSILLVLMIIAWLSLCVFYHGLISNYPSGDPGSFYWPGSTLLLNFLSDPTVIYHSHHQDHVPGYPILIAVVRAISGWDNPVLMQILTLIGWTANLVVVHKILTHLEVRSELRFWGTLLYGAFPLAGMSMAVHPISDTFAMLFLTSGILFYLLDRRKLMVISLAVGLFMHKFIWPGILIVLAVGILKKRFGWMVAVLTLMPLAGYWAAVSMYYKDPLYLISGNINTGIENERQFPLLDGILQTLIDGMAGSFPDLIKGVLAATILAVSLWLLGTKLWTNEPSLLAFIVPIILFGLVTAPYSVFALIRFGKLLIIPFVLYLDLHPVPSRYISPLMPYGFFLSLMSQFAFVYYFTEYFN